MRGDATRLGVLVRQLQRQQEAPRRIGAAGEPAFENGWVNFDATRVARFWRDRGVVFVDGIVKSGALNVAVFTLPDGYRPRAAAADEVTFPVVSNAAVGYVAVRGDGAVVVRSGSNVYVDLGPVRFLAA